MSLFNLTLLYVEDDKDVRESLSEVFKHKVKKVFIAKDGIEALEIFKKNKVHFIISDYKMPKMNGAELCKEVKKLNPLTQFVLLTAYNDTSILLDSIDVGVDKYLQKPINKTQLFNTIEDVSNILEAKFNLEKVNRYLKEAEKLAKLTYWEVDLELKTIFFSKESSELFGLKEAYSYEDFLKVVKNEYKDAFIDIFQNRIFNEKDIDEVVVIDQNGKDIYINIVTKEWENFAYGTKNLLGIFQNVTNYEIDKLRFLEASLTDFMLKIANKKMINLELKKLIKSAKRYGHTFGVIFFDVDNFKALNETYGHLVADKLLLELVELIKNDIRSSDLFGRWGGDEFVIITGYSSADETINLAHKILNKVSNHNWINNIKIGLSIGVAFYQEGDSVSSILNRADKKMLEAKHNGKHQCRC